MKSFEIRTLQNAPEAARPILEGYQQKVGFVPNVFGLLANAPAALNSYAGVAHALEGSRLTASERQIVAVAVAAANECAYCVAAHSTIAGMLKIPPEQVEAVRAGQPVPEARREALRLVAGRLVATRGALTPRDQEAFFAAGFELDHLLDVIALVALHTITNYANRLAGTPLDDAFAPQRWEDAVSRA